MLRRVLVSITATAVAAMSFGLAAADADAATRPSVSAYYATQDTFRHVLTVEGHGFDPAHPTRAIGVRVYVDGHYRAHVTSHYASPYWNRSYHHSGPHRYISRLSYTGTARRVSVVADGTRTVVTRTVRHTQPAAGTRIVIVAARYVGKARYREGGTSPATGFDCSGYTRYAYAAAHVRTLPHNAEAQRHVRGMRKTSARYARPGDLVFYLSGSHAYHVAVYAGHGWQYAAATPRDGIRHQKIWSSHVEYRTLTH